MATSSFAAKIRFLVLLVLLSRGPIHAADPNPLGVKWVSGPGVAEMESTATLKIPADYRFAGKADTQKILKAGGNPISGRELGLLLPDHEKWFVVFEFSDVGYVKDDDKNKLDADAMLKSIIRGNDAANEEREKMKVPPLKITGWQQPPKYDEVTHNLEWAIRGESEGQPVVNYNTRLLGRRGVMEVALVVSPELLPETLPTFKSLLADYEFKKGESYTEFKSGDKIAKYGLAALITGGAAVVAVKTGLLTTILLLFKKLWKLIIVGFVAVGSFIKKLFTREKSTPAEPVEPPAPPFPPAK